MKSLGKQTVKMESYCDGKPLRKWTENRVVYEDKNGNWRINDLGNKKLIAKDANGDFLAIYNSKTINSDGFGLKEVFERLGIKFGKSS